MRKKKSFYIYWDKLNRKATWRRYTLLIPFNGKNVKFGCYRTIPEAETVGRFVLSIIARYEISNDLDGCRYVVKQWAVEQGYSDKKVLTLKKPLDINDFPDDLKPVVKTIKELNRKIYEKTFSRRAAKHADLNPNLQARYMRHWTDEEVEQLKALKPFQTNLEIARILGRTKESVVHKIRVLNKLGNNENCQCILSDRRKKLCLCTT